MWKLTLGLLGLPIGSLSAVAVVRLSCSFLQLTEQEAVARWFMQLAGVLVTSALAGGVLGMVLGLVAGWALDKRHAGAIAGLRRKRVLAVVTASVLLCVALGIYSLPLVDRTWTISRQWTRIAYLGNLLTLHPERADSVVAELLGIASNPQSAVIFRELAIYCLDDLGPEHKSAVAALTRGLELPAPELRWRCAGALGLMGPGATSAVPRLTAALRDPDPKLRRLAARSLWRIEHQPENVVPTLAQSLVDAARQGNQEEFRQSAALVCEIGADAREVLTDLIPLVQSSNDSSVTETSTADRQEIRRVALITVGAIGGGSPQAVAEISRLVNDPDPDLAHAAAGVLARIEPGGSRAATLQTPVVSEEAPAQHVLSEFLRALAANEADEAYDLVAPSSKQQGDPVAYRAKLDADSFRRALAFSARQYSSGRFWPHPADRPLAHFGHYLLKNPIRESDSVIRIGIDFLSGERDTAVMVQESDRWYVANPIAILR